MTKAQQYHEREREWYILLARAYKHLHCPSEKVSTAAFKARHHNHQAIHVARLTRARMAAV